MVKVGELLLLIILTACVTALPFNYNAPETSHTVVLPLERSFIFTIKFENTGEDLIINFVPEVQGSEDWLVILLTGRLLLSPGEEVEIVATFEPTYAPGSHIEELTFDFKFEVNNELNTIPLRVNYLPLDFTYVPSDKVRIVVLDAETKQPVPGAEVLLSLPSGLMDARGVTGPDGAVELELPSSSYLQSLYEKYNASVSFSGYFLEVTKPGYKAFYSYGVETGGSVQVFLEPQRM